MGLRRIAITLLAAAPLVAMAQAEPAKPDAAKPAPGEPAVQRTVIEDDLARIEELKVRGQTTRVVVRSKIGNVKAYEVLTGDAGRDPSQRGHAAGQRVWHILSF